MAERIIEVMAVWEFRGAYPEVQIADGIDFDGLVEGDSDPVFVTLPIGKANALSANKRYYDDSFLRELERQVLENKPVGLMGHLRTEDRATEFPVEAVHWVGARRDGELLWGKGYVPPGEARQRLRRYKASGKKIATSIDATVEGVWDEAVGGYRIKAAGLRLGQIDIAPADRAGIADLAAVPLLSTEMTDAVTEPGDARIEEAETMDREQVIREMTAADVALLPDAVRQAVTAQVAPPAEVEAIAELRATLGLDDQADVVATVREMHHEQRKALVDARIRELANDPERGVKLETVRNVVIELVEFRQPQSVTEAESIYAELVESELIRGLLAAQVSEMAGPSMGTPVQPQATGNNRAYFVIPAESAD